MVLTGRRTFDDAGAVPGWRCDAAQRRRGVVSSLRAAPRSSTRAVREGTVSCEGQSAWRVKRFGSASWVPAATPEQISRSEEHTSELQSLMRISYAVFCLKNKKKLNKQMITYKLVHMIKLR